MNDCKTNPEANSKELAFTDPEIRVLYGKKIEFYRSQLGWNQMQLADASGIHKGNISRIERGLYDMRICTLHRIAKALGKELLF